MNVTPKLDHVNKETFIQDYLHACGVYDIDRYLNPDDSCFDNPFDYPNMDKAIELVGHHFFDYANPKIGIIMD